MKILAIETSCDDTCGAVLDGQRVLSNIISSQVNLHAQWGGVVPDIAKRAHGEMIDMVVAESLRRAFKIKKQTDARSYIDEGMKQVEVVAVTYGPGLAIALGVGIEKAKELALKYKKRLVAVNHIEGHLLSNWVKNSQEKPVRQIRFPALSLTASGGHSKIVLIKEVGKYEVVGETLDDAAGEALDKAAKLMGLGYPGGAVIERLAEGGDENWMELPRPLARQKNFDYSFSGLKTAFYYQIRDWPKEKISDNLANLSASFQKAVFDTLLMKFDRAIDFCEPKTLLASGGVLANENLRKRLRGLARLKNLTIYMPPKKELNTDNAAMIGVAGYFKALRGEFVADIKALDRDARAEL